MSTVFLWILFMWATNYLNPQFSLYFFSSVLLSKKNIPYFLRFYGVSVFLWLINPMVCLFHWFCAVFSVTFWIFYYLENVVDTGWFGGLFVGEFSTWKGSRWNLYGKKSLFFTWIAFSHSYKASHCSFFTDRKSSTGHRPKFQ